MANEAVIPIPDLFSHQRKSLKVINHKKIPNGIAHSMLSDLEGESGQHVIHGRGSRNLSTLARKCSMVRLLKLGMNQMS